LLNTGPVVTGAAVQERVARDYGLFARLAKTGTWRRVGFVRGNTNLINVFTFPPLEVDRLHYLWAGRNSVEHTDGQVRTAEIEVYSDEDSMMDELMDEEDGL